MDRAKPAGIKQGTRRPQPKENRDKLASEEGSQHNSPLTVTKTPAEQNRINRRRDSHKNQSSLETPSPSVRPRRPDLTPSPATVFRPAHSRRSTRRKGAERGSANPRRIFRRSAEVERRGQIEGERRSTFSG
ncbi:double-stranded RNA binding protein-related /DsRBD protein-related [Striga asiatica]|uniref:Double-stranded RNA binding protein-related /DsRBD protein-related n=1 Tax=Striga asiatica TaxID=4170 RepID=A0A5A7R1S0_STRAF|nr:double-stranded RNA binding protein-related /DsRBD protein-related [Striga asiatica]